MVRVGSRDETGKGMRNVIDFFRSEAIIFILISRTAIKGVYTMTL
jgi:hypothetical protein